MNAFARNSKLAAYQSASVHGGVANADPHGLVLMLMDGAMQRLSSARGCIERGERMHAAKSLHSCVTMIAELRGSLNLEKGGSLAQNLSDLYGYMIRRLLLANAHCSAEGVKEVFGLLSEIRGAWAAIGPEVRGSAPQAVPAT